MKRFSIAGFVAWLAGVSLLSSPVWADEAARAPQERSMDGVWEITLPVNGQPVTFVAFYEKDRYTYTIKGLNQPPFGAGKISFTADGKWAAIASRGPSDSGTYQAQGDTLTATGQAGFPVTWHRVAQQPAPKVTWDGGPAGGPFITARDPTAYRVTDVIAALSRTARDWREDAVPIEIKIVSPRPDGLVDLLHNPTSVQVYFFSPAVKQSFFTMTWMPAGATWVCVAPGPLSPWDKGIPAKAIDLSDAIATIRKNGFNDQIEDASLNVWDSQGPATAAWVIHSRQGFDPICIDAVSGKRIDKNKIMFDAAKDFNDRVAKVRTGIVGMLHQAVAQAKAEEAAPGDNLTMAQRMAMYPGVDTNVPGRSSGGFFDSSWYARQAGDSAAAQRLSSGSGTAQDRARYGN